RCWPTPDRRRIGPGQVRAARRRRTTMHSPSRRRFLATSAAVGFGLLAGPLRAGGAQDASSATPGPLLARPVPSTGEMLPVIGAGTSGSYDVAFDSPEYAALREVVRIFFEGGGRVIDTSPNYGRSDTVLGRLLVEGGWRDRCFLASKIAADSRQEAEAQWAESLRRLRTDHVELLQVHNMRHWQEQLPY